MVKLNIGIEGDGLSVIDSVRSVIGSVSSNGLDDEQAQTIAQIVETLFTFEAWGKREISIHPSFIDAVFHDSVIPFNDSPEKLEGTLYIEHPMTFFSEFDVDGAFVSALVSDDVMQMCHIMPALDIVPDPDTIGFSMFPAHLIAPLNFGKLDPENPRKDFLEQADKNLVLPMKIEHRRKWMLEYMLEILCRTRLYLHLLKVMPEEVRVLQGNQKDIWAPIEVFHKAPKRKFSETLAAMDRSWAEEAMSSRKKFNKTMRALEAVRSETTRIAVGAEQGLLIREALLGASAFPAPMIGRGDVI